MIASRMLVSRVTSASLSKQLAERAMHAVGRQARQTFGNLASAASVDATGPARVLGGNDDAVRNLPWTPLELAARSEKRDDRCLHRRGDVHGRGIDADKS